MSRKSIAQNTQPMFVLEESFYPEAWRNDSRMGVLLSEFRVRSINPENYDSKMKFWKEMIRSYCAYKGSGTVSIVELKRVFKRKGTIPYCLQAVFDDMLREGQLLGSEEFRRAPQASWSGWAVDLMVRRPLGWGFGKVKEKLVGNTLDESAEFVCLDTVKKQADEFQKTLMIANKFNVLISLEDLADTIKTSGLTDDGFNLVLHDLSCQQRVTVERLQGDVDDKRKVLLKFAVPGSKVQPITDIERSIYNLEQTEQDLLKVIEKMEQNVADALTTVKQNLVEGKKQLAKSNLKKKHLLEKNLEKKMNVLDNVQTMLARIHDSQTDRHVIEAYKLGSNALKNAFADSGITLDSVDDTLAEMKEIMDQQDEMQTMISAPQSADVDDLELEQELSDLIDLKLAENNISVQPIVPKPEVGPFTQPTQAVLFDFDKEIENRLAALRMDVPSPPSDTSIVGDKSAQNIPTTPAR